MDSLTKLSSYLSASTPPRPEALRRICETAVTVIPNANLVSLWRFNGDQTEVKSIVHYDSLAGVFSDGLVLEQSKFPRYFAEIVEAELIVADEARTHAVTKCFTETYFEPNNIHSLMDFILHKNYRPVGVVCCESKGKQVTWSNGDIENIRALATLVSFYFDVKI